MFRRANALAVLFLLLAVSAAGPARSDADVVVTGVTVPDANQVLIKANATFTAKAATGNNLQVVVDIKNAALAADVPPTVPGQGVIQSVEVKSLSDQDPPVVRVIINLTQDAGAAMTASEGGALLTLTPKPTAPAAPAPAPVAAAPAPAASSAAVPTEQEEVILPYEETRKEVERLMTGAPPPEVGPLPPEYQPVETQQTGLPPILTPMPPAGPDGAATVVGDIYYRTLPDGVQVMVMTNGTVGNYTDYDTKSPAKLYLEFPGLTSVAPQTVYGLHWGGVNNITVSKKSGRVVVVIDFARGLQAYDIKRTGSGVVVTVYKARYAPGGLSSQRYLTQPGDSLASISKKAYGTPDGWTRILSANREAFTARERTAIERSNGSIELGTNVVLMLPNR